MIKLLIVPFFVGLAILLFGIQLMKIGLLQWGSTHVNRWLHRFTQSIPLSFGTGLISTMILQSSSAVTLLAIGMVEGALLTFRQAFGIVLGSNIGTVITAELMILPMDRLAPWLFPLGGLIWILGKGRGRQLGLVLGGFSCILLGMSAITTITQPLQQFQWYQWMLHQQHSILFGVLIGTILTAIIQSSTATTLITMSFMQDGMITLPFAIAIILGSNIGTCATSLLGAIGTSRVAQRVAWTHVILNLLGVFLFLPFIQFFVMLVINITSDPSAQIAHTQTIFNVVCSMLALPFAEPFIRMMERLVPDY